MPIYRKADAGDAGEAGGWLKIKEIYRKADAGDAGESGGWLRIKNVYRKLDDGWEKIFSRLDLTTPTPTTSPTFLNQASSSNIFAGDSLTLTRGTWTNVNVGTSYRLTIYRTKTPNAAVNDVDWEPIVRATQAAGRTISFAETVTIFPLATQQIRYQTTTAHGYSVGDVVTITGMTNSAFNRTNATIQSVSSTTQFSVDNTSGASGSLIGQNGVVVKPVTSITMTAGSNLDDQDAYDEYYYMGEVRVTKSGINYFERIPSSFGYLSRMSFTLSNTTFTNITQSGATINWTINGITSAQISAGFLERQYIEIRLGSSTGTLVKTYTPTSTPVGPGNTVQSYVLNDSATIQPNTLYHARVVAVAYDGWWDTASPTTDFTGATFTTASAAPVNTAAPTISPLNNRSRVPYSTTLTSTLGTWSGTTGSTTYTYQWQFFDTESGWLNAPGTSTNSTYNFSSAYNGLSIRCRVRACNGTSCTDAFATYGVDAPISISAITSSPASPVKNSSATFTATINNYPERYIVNWGDGTTNDSVGPFTTEQVNVSRSHTYTTTGDKTITITAYYKADAASVSNTKTVTVVSVPDDPTGLYTDSVSKDSFFIGWTKVSGVTSYDYGVNTSSTTAPTSEITTGAPTSGQFRNKLYADTNGYELVSGLTASTTYYGWVRARNSVGTSNWVRTSSVTTSALKPPKAVTNLSHDTTARQETSLKFTWTVPTSDSTNSAATGYIYHTNTTALEPATSSYNGTIVNGTDTSVTVSGLTNNTTYYFWIRATNADGTGPNASNAPVSGTTLATSNPPGAPTGASLTIPSTSAMTLSWSQGTGGTPTSYLVAFSTSTTAPTTTSTTTYIDNFYDVGNVTSYRPAGLNAGTTYYAWVRAKNSDGTSGNSNRPSLATRSITITNPKWNTTAPSNFERNTSVPYMRWGWDNGTASTSGTGTGEGLTLDGFYYEIYTTSTGTTLWDSGFRSQRTANSTLTVSGANRIYVQNYNSSSTPAYTASSRFGRIQLNCYDYDFYPRQGAWTGRI
jgi:hypothetical protein